MDELISRQMPHSVEAEQAVLGSILIDERCIPQVVEHLRPESGDFRDGVLHVQLLGNH